MIYLFIASVLTSATPGGSADKQEKELKIGLFMLEPQNLIICHSEDKCVHANVVSSLGSKQLPQRGVRCCSRGMGRAEVLQRGVRLCLGTHSVYVCINDCMLKMY